MKNGNWIYYLAIVGLAALLLWVLLNVSGCYTMPKAKAQHGKAVSTYPEIGADYCARTYPPKDSIKEGKTVTTFDTIYVDRVDTSVNATETDGGSDGSLTIVGEKTSGTLPLKVCKDRIIIQKSVRVDTVRYENTAALDECMIYSKKQTQIAEDQITLRKSWEKKAKKRFWIIAAMGGAFALWLFFRLRKIKK